MLAHTKCSASLTISIIIKLSIQDFYKDYLLILLSTLWEKYHPNLTKKGIQQLPTELNCPAFSSCQIISIILPKLYNVILYNASTGSTTYNLH